MMSHWRSTRTSHPDLACSKHSKACFEMIGVFWYSFSRHFHQCNIFYKYQPLLGWQPRVHATANNKVVNDRSLKLTKNSASAFLDWWKTSSVLRSNLTSSLYNAKKLFSLYLNAEAQTFTRVTIPYVKTRRVVSNYTNRKISNHWNGPSWLQHVNQKIKMRGTLAHFFVKHPFFQKIQKFIRNKLYIFHHNATNA